MLRPIAERSQHELEKMFLNGCEGKRPYESMGHALRAKDKFVKHNAHRRHVSGTSAYRCVFCGSWHLGHDKYGDKR